MATKPRTFTFDDDEILAIGVILTQYCEYRGGQGQAPIAQRVIDKLSKDIARIYRARSKELSKAVNADASRVIQ